MGFYDEISRYYDYIFPVGENQLKFIKECTSETDKKILDIACGSGGYSVELAKTGYRMTAVDIEDEMVGRVKEKAREEGLDVNALKCDMREIQDKIRDKFDVVFCIGNSIVHLNGFNEIVDALKQMRSILEKDGSLVLQIVNYDRIIKYNLAGLPTITNDEIGLEFIRKYRYEKDKNFISFDTTLIINDGDMPVQYDNSIELFPLTSGELSTALKEAGFLNFKFYGDFNYSPYSEDSYMLVVKANAS